MARLEVFLLLSHGDLSKNILFMATTNGLERLLAPLQPEVFFQEFSGRKPVHIPGRPEKFEGLFSRAALSRANFADRSVLVRAAFRDAQDRHREMTIRPEQIPHLFDAGMTICISHLERADPAVGEFVASIDRQFMAAESFFSACYLSPDGKGFGTHSDALPVWLIQLEGRKRWRYSPRPWMDSPAGNVILPPSGDPPPEEWHRVRRPDESGFEEVVLNPGDVLYLPAGTWHCAEAIQFSLALSLGPPRLNCGKLLGSVLQRVMTRHPACRRALPLAYLPADPAGAVPEEVQKAIAEALAETRAALDSLDPLVVQRAWHQLARPEEPFPDSALTSERSPSVIERGFPSSHRPPG